SDRSPSSRMVAPARVAACEPGLCAAAGSDTAASRLPASRTHATARRGSRTGRLDVRRGKMARSGSGTAIFDVRGTRSHRARAHEAREKGASGELGVSPLPTRLGATAGSASSTAASTTVGFLRPRLVDFHRSAAERLLVKLLDGHLRLRVGAHLDKRKSPPLARELVTGHEHGCDRARLREQLLDLRLLHLVGEIADVQPATHDDAPDACARLAPP